jgi:hypothetical protein
MKARYWALLAVAAAAYYVPRDDKPPPTAEDRRDAACAAATTKVRESLVPRDRLMEAGSRTSRTQAI